MKDPVIIAAIIGAIAIITVQLMKNQTPQKSTPQIVINGDMSREEHYHEQPSDIQKDKEPKIIIHGNINGGFYNNDGDVNHNHSEVK